VSTTVTVKEEVVTKETAKVVEPSKNETPEKPKSQWYVTTIVDTGAGGVIEEKRTWVMSKRKANWRECEVVDETDSSIKVHFISYHSRYDEWIEKSSERIKAKRETQDLKKGDNLSAWFPKIEGWAEAEVEEIDREQNEIRINYVGTKDGAYLPLNSAKLSISHKKPNDPFDGKATEYYELVAQGMAYSNRKTKKSPDVTPNDQSNVPAKEQSNVTTNNQNNVTTNNQSNVKVQDDANHQPEQGEEKTPDVPPPQTKGGCCQIL